MSTSKAPKRSEDSDDSLESVESVTEENASVASDELESSGVSDMEAGQVTPRKKAAKEIPKYGKPPINDLGYDVIKLKLFAGIRLFQLVLAMTSFIALSESPAFGMVKQNATVTEKTTTKVGNTTVVNQMKSNGICGGEDTGISSCYNMITSSNYLMATGVLYSMYMILMTVVHGLILFNKLIVENERFIKVQIISDLVGLFFSTTSNAAVGGSTGDDNWRLAVCMMLFITWTQIGSLVLGLKVWYNRKLIESGILKEEDLQKLEAPPKAEKEKPKKKKKTIKKERKKRGIEEKQKKPKSDKKKKKKKKKMAEQPAPENETMEISLTPLQATHSFPGKNKQDFSPERDLAFKKGDILYGINQTDNGAWWFGRDKDGNEGEFPSNRVVEVPQAPESLKKKRRPTPSLPDEE